MLFPLLFETARGRCVLCLCQLVLGNLLRGAAIKQNTQLNRWLVGLGLLQVLTSISFVIITAGKFVLIGGRSECMYATFCLSCLQHCVL